MKWPLARRARLGEEYLRGFSDGSKSALSAYEIALDWEKERMQAERERDRLNHQRDLDDLRVAARDEVERIVKVGTGFLVESAGDTIDLRVTVQRPLEESGLAADTLAVEIAQKIRAGWQRYGRTSDMTHGGVR